MKYIDIIREALNYAWSHVESHHRQMLGDDNEHAAAQSKSDLDRIDAALAILKSMEEQEPVALMSEGSGTIAKPEQVKEMGENWTDVFRIPLYAHSAPSAPADLAGVIKAGDEMHDRLQETRIKVVNGTECYDDMQIMLDSEAQEAWTTVTEQFRKP